MPEISVVCARVDLCVCFAFLSLLSPNWPPRCRVHHYVAISCTDLLAHGIGARTGSVGVGSIPFTCSKPSMGSSDWLRVRQPWGLASRVKVAHAGGRTG